MHLDSLNHETCAVVQRLGALPRDGDHIFPRLNQQNWLRRRVRPAALKLGIRLGGWHDFRHACSRRLRKKGTHPKLVSAILGHSKVNLAMDVYDTATVDELRVPDAIEPN